MPLSTKPHSRYPSMPLHVPAEVLEGGTLKAISSLKILEEDHQYFPRFLRFPFSLSLHTVGAVQDGVRYQDP